jgi:hypothetical protein
MRAATPTLLHHGTSIQIDNSSVSHGDFFDGSPDASTETLSNLGKKTMRQRRLTVSS